MNHLETRLFNMLRANIEFLNTPQISQTCGKLNQKEIRFMGLIFEDELRTVSEIAKSLKMTKSAISQFLEKLVQKKYLTRENDSNDRRKVFINLTELGISIFNEHKECRERLLKKIQKKLKENDISEKIVSEIFQITENAIKEHTGELEA